MVKSPEWLGSGYGEGHRGIEVTTFIGDQEMWKQGEMVKMALTSLFQVFCYVDSHGISCGYLYGLMDIVENSMSQLLVYDRATFQAVESIFSEEKGNIIGDIHRMATFLNPAYTFSEKHKTTPMNLAVNLILRGIAPNDRHSFSEDVSGYNKMLSDREIIVEPMSAKIDHPCAWWENWGIGLPRLRNVAIRILSQPCSTSSCKSSMSTVDAILIKQHMELEGDLNDFDLKLNAVLMQGHSTGTGTAQMWKIVHEVFSRHMSISHSQEVMVEAQYDNGESAHRPLRQLKLRFMTMIRSPLRISQNVEGQNGCRIHVFLVDPSTGCVVEDEIPSTLLLTISVLDGQFPSEEHSTREYIDINDLSSECPYITGDLGVTLIHGKGTLGNFSFNYSGQFKLYIKTHTGFCDEFRILEGISNAFTVENVEAEVSIEQPSAHVDPQNGSSSSNLDFPIEIANWMSNFPDQTLPTSNDTCYYSDQGFGHSLAHTAERRVKKEALAWNLQSRGRQRTLKRGSQALKRKRRGEELFEPKREVCSTGSNNVNQEEDGEKVNGKAVEIEGIDSLSSTSALNSSSGAKPVGETNEVALPPHPSTALQLSLTGDRVLDPQKAQLRNANDANQQTTYKKGRKRDDLWRYAERMDSRFKCKFCGHIFCGGIVRLRAHLSGITGQGIQVCSKVPEDVKSAVLLASNIGPIKKKSKLCCKEILSAADEE